MTNRPAIPRRRTLVTCLAVCAALTAFSPKTASATSLRPINLAETVDFAQAAFVGHITNVQIIQTRLGAGEQITASVLRRVFDVPVTSSTVTWVQYRPGRGGARLPGMPQFVVGRDYLVFLSGRSGNSPYSAPVGFGQGAFLIHRDTKTSATYARNEFYNASLLKNLDVDALSRKMVERNPRTKSLDSQQKTRAVAVDRVRLRARSAGASSLDALVEAAQALRAARDSGTSASKAFYTKKAPAPVTIGSQLITR